MEPKLFNIERIIRTLAADEIEMAIKYLHEELTKAKEVEEVQITFYGMRLLCSQLD